MSITLSRIIFVYKKTKKAIKSKNVLIKKNILNGLKYVVTLVINVKKFTKSFGFIADLPFLL